MSNWTDVRESIRFSVDWASQILYHLSFASTTMTFHLGSGTLQSKLEPNPALVSLLSFAIDQYFVVM